MLELPSNERGTTLGLERTCRGRRGLRELPSAALGEESAAKGLDPDRGVRYLPPSAALGSVQALASPAARGHDGLHLVPFAARLHRAGAAREKHHQPDLHLLSRRISRAVPLGTSAGH